MQGKENDKASIFNILCTVKIGTSHGWKRSKKTVFHFAIVHCQSSLTQVGQTIGIYYSEGKILEILTPEYKQSLSYIYYRHCHGRVDVS